MTGWIRRLEIASVVLLLAAGIWIFWGTPIEHNMGFVQKIMYLHVPSVLVTYFAFFLTFACSIGYLWKRELLFDQIAKASAEIGVLFCGMVLLTGAIWGKPTWGTYWVWDARLTTTLLLFLIFLGYFLLRSFVPDRDRQARLAAIVGIIGFLDIPIIHQSVKWWRTLHQPSTLFKTEMGKAKPDIPPELLYPLLASMAAMMVFYGYLLLARLLAEQKREEIHQLIHDEH